MFPEVRITTFHHCRIQRREPHLKPISGPRTHTKMKNNIPFILFWPRWAASLQPTNASWFSTALRLVTTRPDPNRPPGRDANRRGSNFCSVMVRWDHEMAVSLYLLDTSWPHVKVNYSRTTPTDTTPTRSDRHRRMIETHARSTQTKD